MRLFILLFSLATTAAAQSWQLQLTFNNPTCKNDASCQLSNCLCSTQIRKAQCTSVTNCPDIYSNSSAFTLLTVDSTNTITTVGPNGTSWTFNDTDATLVSNTSWIYAITNAYVVQTPSSPPSAYLISPGIAIPASTVQHLATLNYTSNSCTNANSCWFQLWRAPCSSTTNCPLFTGSTADGWIMLSHASFPVWNTTNTGTTWQVQDAGADVPFQGNTTYVYVATTCWAASNCPAYSSPSDRWIGTTGAGKTLLHPGRKRK